MENLNWVIDIGNSRIKAASFIGDQIQEVSYWPDLVAIRSAIDPTSKIMICSVKNRVEDIKQTFDGLHHKVLDLSTQLPIRIQYDTPETLGTDRIAAASGAYLLYPDHPLLIIDAGSCVTYDLVDENAEFQGGMISPGIRLRFGAMHDYTSNLPDLQQTWEEYDTGLIGKTTRDCMVSGVINGLVGEINALISRFISMYPELTIVLTGGDSGFFETRIKAPIFAHPNLVLIGLNRIIKYNEFV